MASLFKIAKNFFTGSAAYLRSFCSTVHPTDGVEASTSEQISNGNTQQQHDAASQPQQSDVQPVWNSGSAAAVSSYNNNSGAHSSPQVKRLRRPSLLVSSFGILTFLVMRNIWAHCLQFLLFEFYCNYVNW